MANITKLTIFSLPMEISANCIIDLFSVRFTTEKIKFL